MNNEQIGFVIRCLRRRKGLSQAALAKMMPGWHCTTLAKVELGERALKAVEMIPLAAVLDVQPADLLDASIIDVSDEVSRLRRRLSALTRLRA